MEKRKLKKDPPPKVFWVGDQTKLERCKPTGYEAYVSDKLGWQNEYKDKYGVLHYGR